MKSLLEAVLKNFTNIKKEFIIYLLSKPCKPRRSAILLKLSLHDECLVVNFKRVRYIGLGQDFPENKPF